MEISHQMDMVHSFSLKQFSTTTHVTSEVFVEQVRHPFLWGMMPYQWVIRTFWGNILSSSSKVYRSLKNSSRTYHPLKLRKLSYLSTSVCDYLVMYHYIPEDVPHNCHYPFYCFIWVFVRQSKNQNMFKLKMECLEYKMNTNTICKSTI